MRAASSLQNPREDGVVVAVNRIIKTDVLVAAVSMALVLTACGTNGGDEAGDAPQNSFPPVAADSSAPGTMADEPGTSGDSGGDRTTPDASAAKQSPPDPDYCASGDLSLTLGEGESAVAQ